MLPEASTFQNRIKLCKNPKIYIGTWTKGRPKQRWEVNIIQDIPQLNIKNWTACVQDRVKWKKSLDGPNLPTKEVKRLMMMVKLCSKCGILLVSSSVLSPICYIYFLFNEINNFTLFTQCIHIFYVILRLKTDWRLWSSGNNAM
jgi:hypothetical protein